MRIAATGAVTGTRIEPLAEVELEFLDRATTVDGSPAISGGLLAIAAGDDDAHDAQTASSVWRVYENDEADSRERLVGYGIRALQGERHAAEFVVDPDRRRLGVGEALLSEILAEEPDSWCWSHGDHPGARRLAAIHGLGRDRVLYQMRTDTDLALSDLPEVSAPEGVTIRSFTPGDEAGWLRVNNAAFDWHPEQGAQTLDDIARIVTAEDFDPDSVIIAARDNEAAAADESSATATADAVIGFHQTKSSEDETIGRLGEVYVVGVDPSIHARGVGRALTLEGMRRMVAAGARAIELYVESDNEAALGLYQRLGFHVAVAHVSYAPASSTAGNQE
ncbi:mycothiol synthase [Brevibacterium sp.]|uniref:mycothiol synthase n=1 Tax=Brevibacterium sp. TaxID=1701 RepID=UPI00281170D1|nr:mycothiol synthase [Brevibacterium sp.]